MTTRRLLAALSGSGVPLLGLVVNMCSGKEEVGLGVRPVWRVPYDPRVESSLGDPDSLLSTAFGRSVGEVASYMAGLIRRGNS